MDDPGMLGVGSQASMDDPGMFRVSRESMDTLTGGVGSQASRDVQSIQGIHGYSDRGGRKPGIHG